MQMQLNIDSFNECRESENFSFFKIVFIINSCQFKEIEI